MAQVRARRLYVSTERRGYVNDRHQREQSAVEVESEIVTGASERETAVHAKPAILDGPEITTYGSRDVVDANVVFEPTVLEEEGATGATEEDDTDAPPEPEAEAEAEAEVNVDDEAAEADGDAAETVEADAPEEVDAPDEIVAIVPYAEQSVAQLRELLDARGLPSSGVKAKLIERLEAADA